MTEHEAPSLSPLGFLTVRATRAASVKASLTPRFFIAEHSVGCISGGFSGNIIRDATTQQRIAKTPNLPRYRNAFTFSATARPCL